MFVRRGTDYWPYFHKLYYTHQGINKKGAKVYPHALEKDDMRRVVEMVKEEGFIAPPLDPIADE